MLIVNTIVLKMLAVRAMMAAMTTMPAVPVDRDKIRQLREDLGLTQAEAAKRAGFHGHQQWYAVESGKRSDPSVSTIQRIAAALGVTIDELVTPLDGDEWKDA
ncbi:MAG: helix-turn-helix transcriptional regulator [Planctomycetota bacterium]